MAHLIPYKASVKERCNKHNTQYSVRQKTCRICGNPATVGVYCQACSDFLKNQRRREKKQNEH